MGVCGGQTTLIEITVKGCNDDSLISSRENMDGLGVALHAHHGLLNCKTNIIRKQIILHNFLHSLGKTYTCGWQQRLFLLSLWDNYWKPVFMGNTVADEVTDLRAVIISTLKMVQGNCRHKKINIISQIQIPKTHDIVSNNSIIPFFLIVRVLIFVRNSK